MAGVSTAPLMRSTFRGVGRHNCGAEARNSVRPSGSAAAVGLGESGLKGECRALRRSGRRAVRPWNGARFAAAPMAKVAEDAVGTGRKEPSGAADSTGDVIGLESSFKLSDTPEKSQRSLRLVIAGGGIGGLVLALAAKKKGLDVVVLERDVSAIRGEGQYRGPIQVQSNALAALEAIDNPVAEEIMDSGCVTGDRINGLVDGVTGSWYCKFDTFTPAVTRGLPVTRVISRMTLQSILSEAVGPEIIQNGCNVVDYEDDGSKVTAVLDDGRRIEGDILVGADGIRSKVRDKLFGPSEATYSDYTCYTGIADFCPADIETVGYRIFLGSKQYFVSSDVGGGKMQWYAFHKQPAGGKDVSGGRKEKLLELFGHWCDGAVDLILATPEEDILRRDIYDRRPILTWSKGRVTLLGDSAHAMQPNMGQGGCMAIEDSFQLALDLSKAVDKMNQNQSVDIAQVLKRYEGERRLRVGAIHGMARMAAIMASTYKAYLGDGLGPLEVLRNFKIPHPGRVGGRFFVTIGMPLMMSWVLGGNQFALEGRAPRCRIEDKADQNLRRWFRDDDALERATLADWYLLPLAERMASGNLQMSKMTVRISGVNSKPTIIGSAPGDDGEANIAVIAVPQVAPRHARIHSADGACFLTDLKSRSGTWITSVDGDRYRVPSAMPVRIRQSDVVEFGEDKQGAFRVKLWKTQRPAVSEASSAV